MNPVNLMNPPVSMRPSVPTTRGFRPSWRMLGMALVLGLVLAFGLSAPAQAQTTPMERVEAAIDGVLETLRAEAERAREDPEFVLGVIESEVLPLIDVEGMARLILARHWRDASETQRERFTAAFRDTLLNAYGVRLADHLDREVIMIPQRSRTDERMAVVATEIRMGRGEPNIVVNYRLRPVEGEWRVFDVEVEGLSFVANFRTHFNSEIQRHGLDTLIERLEAEDPDLVEEAILDGNTNGG